MTYQEWFDALPPWVQKDIGQSMTVDEFKAKMFHVDEAKFTDWFERIKKGYNKNPARDVVDDPLENFIVDALPPHIQRLLETDADSLFFSKGTLQKQFDSHPKLTAQEYISVFNKVGGCKEIYDRSQSHIGLIIEIDKQHYMLILKPTKDFSEAYVISLYAMDDRSLLKARKRKRLY